MTLLNISCSYPYLWISCSCIFIYTEANIDCGSVWTIYNVPALTTISLNLNYKTMEQKEARLLHKVYQVHEGFSSLTEDGITNEIPTSMFRLQTITLLIVATYVEFLIINFFSSVVCGFWGLNRMRCCAVTSVTSPSSGLLSPPVTNKSSRAISCPTPWKNK